MSSSSPARRRLPVPAAKTVTVVLLTVTAIVLLSPIGYLAYAVYWIHVWEGDVPSVIEEIHSPGRSPYYTVELNEQLPPDALDPDFDGRATWFPHWNKTALPELKDARVGESVTCHVRQTYQANRDFDRGPQTKITHCWR
jgi:hypothetical protein